MDELVKLVSEKTGLSEDMSKKAVDIVLNYVKDKLPPALGSQLDAILDGDGIADDLLKGLGGLLSK